MTQKELLYLEDAVGHEKSIIKILEESIKEEENDELVDFMNDEIDIHTDLKNNLMNILEEKANG